MSGETKQTYTSQGQALFGNRKQVPCRCQTMHMHISQYYYWQFTCRNLSPLATIPYTLQLPFNPVIGGIHLSIGTQILFLLYMYHGANFERYYVILRLCSPEPEYFQQVQTPRTSTQYETRTCLEEVGFIPGREAPDAGVEGG